MADAAPEVQIAEEFAVIIIFNIVVVAQLAQAETIPEPVVDKPEPVGASGQPTVAETSEKSEKAEKASPEPETAADPETTADDVEADGGARRVIVDIAMLILRVAVGAAAVVHGLQKLLGWWDGPGIDGFEDILLNPANPSIGFDESAAHWLAGLGAITETAAGALLIVGLVTPVAASALLGVLLVGTTYKVTLAGELWYPSDSKGGIEYQVLLVAGLLTILLIGSGRLALDYGRGWATRPKWGSLALAVLGIAVAVTIWVVFNGTNPLDSPGNPV